MAEQMRTLSGQKLYCERHRANGRISLPRRYLLTLGAGAVPATSRLALPLSGA